MKIDKINSILYKYGHDIMSVSFESIDGVISPYMYTWTINMIPCIIDIIYVNNSIELRYNSDMYDLNDLEYEVYEPNELDIEIIGKLSVALKTDTLKNNAKNILDIFEKYDSNKPMHYK